MAEAVELAAAYVSITGSTKDLGKQIAKDLSKDLDKVAIDLGSDLMRDLSKTAVAKAGKVGKQIGSELADDLAREFDNLGDDLADQFDGLKVGEGIQIEIDQAEYDRIFDEIVALEEDIEVGVDVDQGELNDLRQQLEKAVVRAGSDAAPEFVDEIEDDWDSFVDGIQSDDIDVDTNDFVGDLDAEWEALVNEIEGEQLNIDADRAFDGLENEGRTSGRLGGGQWMRAFGIAAVAGVAAVATAVGAGLVKGTLDAIDRERVGDRFAASLGLTDAEALEYGQTAGDLYADAYGESLGQVSDTLRTALLVTNPEIPDDDLKDITATALNMEAAFGGAAGEYLTLAGQLEKQGLFDTVDTGLDFLIASFQQLPAEMQQPLTEAVKEYGVFLQDLGFSTEEQFGLLTEFAGQGEFALDKAGDALKEFQIRASAGDSAEALEDLGFSAEDMARRIAEGGPDARSALDEVVDGLEAIEDPGERARRAMEIFGTPLEDLGAEQIPDFLATLDKIPGGFDDVGAASDNLDTTLNDNLGTRLETLKRQGFQELADIAETSVIPALEGIADWGQQLSDIYAEEGAGGALDFIKDSFVGLWEDVSPELSAFIASAVDWIRENGPVIAETLGEWAVEFVEWVAPQIPPLLGELAKLLGELVQWTATVAIPAIAKQMNEWAEEFGVWVMTDAWPWLLDELGNLKNELVGWITGTAAPAIGDAAVELAGEMVDWVKDAADDLLDEAGKLKDRFVDFMIVDLKGGITGAASGMFDALIDAFKESANSIIGLWNDLDFPAIKVAGQTIIPSFGSPNIPYFHDGGVVPGAPGQEILAVLEAGETVVPADGGGAGDTWNVYVTERPLHEELEEARALAGVG